MRKSVLAAVVLSCSLAATPLKAQAVVETFSLWDGNTSATPFSLLNTESYGQTFTAPAQYLNSWSLWLAQSTAGGVGFTANIAQWTGSTIGSVLWSSGPFTGPTTSTFQQYTFLTGGVSLLTGGQSYIFYLDAISGSGRLAAGIIDPGYAGGRFEFNNDPDETTTWDTFFEADMVFRAEFDRVPAETVPEPASMTLLATGLAGMAAARRRKARV